MNSSPYEFHFFFYSGVCSNEAIPISFITYQTHASAINSILTVCKSYG